LHCKAENEIYLFSEHGFTLVELMVVIAIIAIVAGFTFAELNSDSYRLKTAARTLKASLQKARLLSVKNSCPVYVDFDLDADGGSDGTINRGYTIWCDLDGNGSFTMKDDAGNAVTDKRNSVEFVDEVYLPSVVSAGVVASGQGGPTTGPPPSGPTLPTDGVSYGGDRVRFTPQGTGTSGWFYLHCPGNNKAGTCAIGTNNIGRVRSLYFLTGGGGWR